MSKELVLEKIDDSHFNKSTEVSQPKQLMSTEFKRNVINESLPTKSYFKKEVKSLICGVKISVLDINATPKWCYVLHLIVTNIHLFQNLIQMMEEIKPFPKLTEQKVCRAWNDTPKHFCAKQSKLVISKNRIFNLEKELIEEDEIISFLLKQKNRTNNITSSVNRKVTENDEILET